MIKQFLECGKILSPHGVRGVVKVECWCDSPKVLAAQKRVFFAERDGGYKEAEILTASVSGSFVLLHLCGVCDRESAQSLKNTTLYLHRDDIPKADGRYFLADIIGLDAIDIETGERLGKVSDITDAARGKLYTVKTDGGKEILIPDTGPFIKKIDLDKGVFFELIPGFFDEE